MGSVDHAISLVVLNCGYTAPSIEKERGQFDDLFDSLLLPAVERLNAKRKATRVKINVKGYDSVKQIYPLSLDGVNAIIVSGSPNGAYQDFEWIRKLNRFVSYVYHEHPSIKLYGSCFGHQIICQALFSDRGVVVEKDPAGWELGVGSVNITDEFAQRFPQLLGSKTMRLQFLHGDHVIFPENSLPDGIQFVGSTSHCQVQGIYQKGRILTYQGHPEFDEFINTEYLKLVGNRVGWEPIFTNSAVAAAQAEDDADIAADIMMAFFLDLEVDNGQNT